MENIAIINRILQDPYYKDVYKKYEDINIVKRAGFFDSSLYSTHFYKLDFITTPIHKLSEGDNPIVLLSTGGFNPIHKGHIDMMEMARQALNDKGFNVIGGYISPSHDDYVKTKKYFSKEADDRVFECQRVLDNHEWLMVDPFEALYCNKSINFTNAIERLELYLKKHVNSNIKVAYVYGSDNVNFSYCFEEKGIGVCVERECGKDIGYFSTTFQNSNVIFVENKSSTNKLNSSDIRRNNLDRLKNSKKATKVGTFVIRDEGVLPIYKLHDDKSLLISAQDYFITNLKNIFMKYLTKDVNVEVVSLDEQINYANEKIGDSKTISMDSYYNGTFNVGLSRLFNISDTQVTCVKLESRYNKSIQEQIRCIKSGTYTLVDDDSVSGKTISLVKDMLPSNVKIDDVVLLSSCTKDDIFDVVDCRDFIIGALNSGLLVKFGNMCSRVPYIQPYVNLTTRANIHPKYQKDFSKDILRLNINFYEKLGDIKLNELNNDFQLLMYKLGHNPTMRIIDLCEWHLMKFF